MVAVAGAFDKIDLIEEHNQVYLKQRKKKSFSLPTTAKLSVSSQSRNLWPQSSNAEPTRHCFTVLQGLSYTAELPQHSGSVSQAVSSSGLHSHQMTRGTATSCSWQDQAARGRNCSTRRRAPGRGKGMACAITSSGCWLQKLMVTEPSFFSRITYPCFPALLSLPFLILLYKQ